MMPTKRCRVCGKEYQACRNARRTDGVFRWREVACSPECGAIYLSKILSSRVVSEVPFSELSAPKQEYDLFDAEYDTYDDIEDDPDYIQDDSDDIDGEE